MPLKFKILASSSSGNCSLLQTENTNILIDAGFSGKRTIEMLAQHGLSPEQLHGVFFTHEHGDHTQGLRGLAKYDNIKFCANFATANVLEEKLKKSFNWLKFDTGIDFKFRDVYVQSFSIPHDAKDPVGYTFSVESINGFAKIAWMTDLGYIPQYVTKYLNDANLIVIESNYDHKLLEADTKRPIYIKERIRGKYGHLSNDAVVNFCKNHLSNIWQNIVLAHLSSDCNDSNLILSGFTELSKTVSMPMLDIVDPEIGLNKVFVL